VVAAKVGTTRLIDNHFLVGSADGLLLEDA
jgi:hypothetical protein